MRKLIETRHRDELGAVHSTFWDVKAFIGFQVLRAPGGEMLLLGIVPDLQQVQLADVFTDAETDLVLRLRNECAALAQSAAMEGSTGEPEVLSICDAVAQSRGKGDMP